MATLEGSRLDIRLPSVSPSLRSRRDIRKAVVGVSPTGEEGEEAAACGDGLGAALASRGAPASGDDSDENDGRDR